MQVSDFDYHLPKELIAQTPAVPRDSARLLVYNRQRGELHHKHISDLPDLLPPSVVVANNSKVRRSRLWGITSDEKEIEVFILEPLRKNEYRCVLGGTRHKKLIKQSIKLFSDPGRTTLLDLKAEVLGSIPGPGMITYHLVFSGVDDIEAALEENAELPLPPYITERASSDGQYQTVYAKELGSSAAPTAGLHFTPQLIQKLEESGKQWNEITLHVGLGTFLPLRENEISANRLHHERCFVSEETALQVNGVLPTIAIGTTSVRALESHCQNGHVVSGWKETDIFIHPGYQFQCVDGLLTNFHLPKSSLLLLVAAFIGTNSARDILLQLYAEAVKEHYRFFSFGDAMLIL